jgi:hypothetical protein
LKEWLWAESYPRGSLSINLTLGGFLLAVYRQVAAFAPSGVDRAIMGYAMQDAARHVSYGLGALRYYLQYQPEERAAIVKYLDDAEHAIAGLIGAPELLEPLIIICGGGLETSEVSRGREAVRKFIRLVYREYTERLSAVGINRSGSRLGTLIAQAAA